ncbi:sesquiterpene cyclase [Chitinophaga sp. Cy-1792]|uniref:terpene synthase family protein n=1 Tax=Chitinophaga sp. Cy-1792 TaxID=2608339 RepID=UPI0014243E25|nr:sesquiterpene cyclase [Chitinophaga sp. Cy-1792]NIG56422.1 sesquiterpene cyclase [Chitinophaga sp. Cy-1792]
MKNTNPVENLAGITIPAITIPWPGAISPLVEDIETGMLQWAAEFGLIVNPTHAARIRRSKFAWFVARSYPNADITLLQMAADYGIWLFLVDDMLIDRMEMSPQERVTSLSALLDILDLEKAGQHPVYGELALLDLCRRFRKNMNTTSCNRMMQAIRLWAAAAGLQILDHERAETPALSTYVTIRRYIGAVETTISLNDVLNYKPVTDAVYNSPEVYQLRLIVNNVIAWGNDVHSAIIEAQQPGHFRNMPLIYASQGHTLQEGITFTVDNVYQEIARFSEIEASISTHADEALLNLIQGFKDCISGYYNWVLLDTQRYSKEHMAMDANDSKSI